MRTFFLLFVLIWPALAQELEKGYPLRCSVSFDDLKILEAEGMDVSQQPLLPQRTLIIEGCVVNGFMKVRSGECRVAGSDFPLILNSGNQEKILVYKASGKLQLIETNCSIAFPLRRLGS